MRFRTDWILRGAAFSLMLTIHAAAFNPPAMGVEPVVVGIGWTEAAGEWVPQLDVQLRMQVSSIWSIGVQVAPILSDPDWGAGSIDLKRYGLVATPRTGLGPLILETPIEISAVNASYLTPITGENGKPEIDEVGGWGFALTAGAVLAYPINQAISIALQGGWRQAWVWVHGVDEDVFTGPQVAVQFRWLP